jgi:two-component system, cell cycle response regulator DivK
MEEVIDTKERSQLNILIAEDDKINFFLLREILKELNCNIFHAENGLKAVEMFNSNKIDIILMDIQMPVMDGFEAVAEIRKIDKNVPIIAQTGYSLDNGRDKCLNAGCNEFIAKPIKRLELIEKINNLLSVVQ